MSEEDRLIETLKDDMVGEVEELIREAKDSIVTYREYIKELEGNIEAYEKVKCKLRNFNVGD